MRYNQTIERKLTSDQVPMFYVSPDRYVNCNWKNMGDDAIQTYFLGEEWDPDHGYGYVWSSSPDGAEEKATESVDLTCTPGEAWYTDVEYC